MQDGAILTWPDDARVTRAATSREGLVTWSKIGGVTRRLPGPESRQQSDLCAPTSFARAFACLVGLLLLAVAVVYFAEPAGSLPSFFPGHEAGSGHHHVKHGIAALVLAIVCFIFAWFQTEPPAPDTA
jgi:hypothetical protein